MLSPGAKLPLTLVGKPRYVAVCFHHPTIAVRREVPEERSFYRLYLFYAAVKSSLSSGWMDRTRRLS